MLVPTRWGRHSRRMRSTPLPPPSHDAGRLHADGVPASRLQLPAGAFDTLLDGLCARFPRVPRPVWLDRFARGRVQDARGLPLDAAMPYRVGQEVRYFREVDDEPPVPFEERIVHADAHLVIADKPHFLPVTPAGGHVRETLLARLVGRLGNPDLVPLHRIDRDTAGLVQRGVEACARPGARRARRAGRLPCEATTQSSKIASAAQARNTCRTAQQKSSARSR